MTSPFESGPGSQSDFIPRLRSRFTDLVLVNVFLNVFRYIVVQSK